MLTERIVRDAKPGPKTHILWDSTVKGLGLRITPKGVKSYILNYRINGRRAPGNDCPDFRNLPKDSPRAGRGATGAHPGRGRLTRSNASGKQGKRRRLVTGCAGSSMSLRRRV